MPALVQVRGVIRALPKSMMVLCKKIVNNTSLKMLTILAKRLISVPWLGPGRVSADGYITVYKIEMEISKNGGQVKTVSF